MTIAAHRRYPGKARRGTSLKDGRFSRAVEVHEGNVIRVVSTEGETLHENRDLPADFAVQSLSTATSSFGTPHLLIYVYGFTPGSDDQECYVLSCDYAVQPPQF